MPFLMVNLDDVGDMQRSVRQLQRRLRRGGDSLPHSPGDHAKGPQGGGGNKEPLKQKLMRIQQRGVWKFLVGIAKLDDTPRSLPELDIALNLPRNKMRSTKAIFAKLENRFDVRFLKPADEIGEDESGNPRYLMPPRIRRAILELAD
jgi:hypothetical protein